MFFEEEYINNLLKCDKCIQNFSKYDQPKSLPCGKIICDKCETLIYKESNEERKFKCTLCSNEHSIPDEGFNLNDLAYSLITAKPKEIWRGKKYEQLKINLNKIEQLVQELKLNYENGADKIKEHCIEQRRLVQLSTEKKIEKINHTTINRRGPLYGRRIGRGTERRPCLWQRNLGGIFDAWGGLKAWPIGDRRSISMGLTAITP